MRFRNAISPGQALPPGRVAHAGPGRVAHPGPGRVAHPGPRRCHSFPPDAFFRQGGGAERRGHGAKGVVEPAKTPAAPAMHAAYYSLDGDFRRKLPMEGTFSKQK